MGLGRKGGTGKARRERKGSREGGHGSGQPAALLQWVAAWARHHTHTHAPAIRIGSTLS